MDREVIIYIFSSIVLVVYVVIVHVRWNRKFRSYIEKVKKEKMQILQLEKMASLGTLSAGVAHEINNPLTFLITNLNLIYRYVKEAMFCRDEKIKADKMKEIDASLEECVDGANRIKKIVRDLLSFSQSSKGRRSFINVNNLLDSTISILWNEIKHEADLVKDCKNVSHFWADSSQLSQVFLNVILNAIESLKAKKKRGVINIATYEDEKNVFVKVSDSGCGMTKDELSSIYEPFFTTKNGTGLGLYVSKSIIDNHGGKIAVYSELGKGSTFTIILPKASKSSG